MEEAGRQMRSRWRWQERWHCLRARWRRRSAALRGALRTLPVPARRLPSGASVRQMRALRWRLTQLCACVMQLESTFCDRKPQEASPICMHGRALLACAACMACLDSTGHAIACGWTVQARLKEKL